MIKEETELLYAFKGAYTYADLQDMTDYEFMLIGEAFKDIKETEKIVYERMKEQQGSNSTTVVDTIILPNSRFNLPKDEKAAN